MRPACVAAAVVLMMVASASGFDHDPLWVSAPASAPAPVSPHHIAPSSPHRTQPHPNPHHAQPLQALSRAAKNNAEYHLKGKPQLAQLGQPGNMPDPKRAIKTCKGAIDYCDNEAECCEIDTCNIWQHVGRDVAVLLVLYAKWCPVSRDFMLQYDLLRDEYKPQNRVLVAKADADANPGLVVDLNVAEYPQIVLFQRDCYWTPYGCLDPQQHFTYNGTSNDAEEIRVWVEDTMIYIAATLASKDLPPVEEGPCKVTQVIQPPIDMRAAFKFPEDEGKQLLPSRTDGDTYKMAAERDLSVQPRGHGPIVLAPDETQSQEMVPRPLGEPVDNDAPYIEKPPDPARLVYMPK